MFPPQTGEAAMARLHRWRVVNFASAVALPLLLSNVVGLWLYSVSARQVAVDVAVAALIAVAVTALVAWRLGRALSRYCDEIVAARASAEQLAELRGDVLASVSHDLQSPLATASGYLQLLQARVDAVPDASALTLRAGLTQTQRSVARMRQMTSELVDAARIEAGHDLPLQLQPTDLLELTCEVVQEQSPRSRDRFRIQCEGSDFWLMCDPSRISRVIANLLSNALKYSPSDSRIDLDVRRHTEAGCQWLLLTVCDHGIGIPHADLPHVFERFRRGSNTSDEALGMGLGLAGVRSIVEQHRGHVVIESEQGVGTAVYVYFPVARVAPATSVASQRRFLPLAG
jgi:signal transduction histidine kinase